MLYYLNIFFITNKLTVFARLGFWLVLGVGVSKSSYLLRDFLKNASELLEIPSDSKVKPQYPFKTVALFADKLLLLKNVLGFFFAPFGGIFFNKAPNLSTVISDAESHCLSVPLSADDLGRFYLSHKQVNMHCVVNKLLFTFIPIVNPPIFVVVSLDHETQ